MDILFEISAQYVEQIIRRKFHGLGRVCLSAEQIDIGLGAPIDVRRVVPAIESVRLTEADGPNGPEASISIQFRPRQ